MPGFRHGGCTRNSNEIDSTMAAAMSGSYHGYWTVEKVRKKLAGRFQGSSRFLTTALCCHISSLCLCSDRRSEQFGGRGCQLPTTAQIHLCCVVLPQPKDSWQPHWTGHSGLHEGTYGQRWTCVFGGSPRTSSADRTAHVNDVRPGSWPRFRGRCTVHSNFCAHPASKL